MFSLSGRLVTGDFDILYGPLTRLTQVTLRRTTASDLLRCRRVVVHSIHMHTLWAHWRRKAAPIYQPPASGWMRLKRKNGRSPSSFFFVKADPSTLPNIYILHHLLMFLVCCSPLLCAPCAGGPLRTLRLEPPGFFDFPGATNNVPIPRGTPEHVAWQSLLAVLPNRNRNWIELLTLIISLALALTLPLNRNQTNQPTEMGLVSSWPERSSARRSTPSRPKKKTA